MKIGSINKYWFVGAFLILMWLPLIGSMLNADQQQLLPDFEISSRDYPSGPYGYYRLIMDLKNEVDEHFSENFPLRSQFVQLYLTLKSNFMKGHPLPDKVVEGTEDWLFLGDADGNVIKESVGMDNFSEEEIDRIKRNLTNRQSWLDSNQIQYYIAIAPNKHSFYQNHLPIAHSKRNTKLEQVMENFSVEYNILDLKERLDTHENAKLFYQSDTHWTEEGAYLGYNYLMHHIRQDFDSLYILNPNSFIRKEIEFSTGDLVRLLGRSFAEKQTELDLSLIARADLQADRLEIPSRYRRDPDLYESRYTTTRNGVKVLVLGDSFFINMKKYAAESFGHTVALNDYTFDKSIILDEKPDLVIHLIVERNIDVLLKE